MAKAYHTIHNADLWFQADRNTPPRTSRFSNLTHSTCTLCTHLIFIITYHYYCLHQPSGLWTEKFGQQSLHDRGKQRGVERERERGGENITSLSDIIITATFMTEENRGEVESAEGRENIACESGCMHEREVCVHVYAWERVCARKRGVCTCVCVRENVCMWVCVWETGCVYVRV